MTKSSPRDSFLYDFMTMLDLAYFLGHPVLNRKYLHCLKQILEQCIQ